MASLHEIHKMDKAREDAIVHIRVGPRHQIFVLPKELVCQSSPRLAELIKTSPEEISPRELAFPAVDAKVFKLFVNWLPKHNLGSATDDIARWTKPEQSLINIEDEKGGVKEDGIPDERMDFERKGHKDVVKFSTYHMENLLRLYMFADMARIPGLKNDCIKKYYEFNVASGYITTDWLTYVWQYTTKTHLIRKFFLDLLTWETDTQVIALRSRDFPDDLKVGLMVNMSYVIQISRYGSTHLEGSNPLRNLDKYYEKVE